VTPSDVFTSTEPEICAEVDTFGTAPILSTQVSVGPTSNLLVSFSSEWSGPKTDTELLLSFLVNDDAGTSSRARRSSGVSAPVPSRTTAER